MTNRNKTEVYIYGSRYTVSGAESEEYIHKLALYVDKKMREFSEVNSALNSGMISVLAAINIADDYFKTLDKLENITKNQHIETELIEKEYKQKVEELTLQIQKFKSDSVTMEEAMTSKTNELEVIKSEFEKNEKSLKEQIELLMVEAEYKDEAIANQLEELTNEHTQNKDDLKDQINKLKDENAAKEQAMAELTRKFEQLESEYKQMEELYQEEYNRIKNEKF
ncbi:cell division protein ZapA [Clostridium sp. BNL1100]|uniref:cell division protein ZapA n=1 Tax=Clostridium sp. BNL1100 TaxID=755731 RepID=UPI00024A7DD9|nr:cell division protein ZapA [Clostridium sp. BNL1100]AEY65800.1 hypothetical protein Clo1100_1580 [Clostridium sp. BNL1100]